MELFSFFRFLALCRLQYFKETKQHAGLFTACRPMVTRLWTLEFGLASYLHRDHRQLFVNMQFVKESVFWTPIIGRVYT